MKTLFGLVAVLVDMTIHLIFNNIDFTYLKQVYYLYSHINFNYFYKLHKIIVLHVFLTLMLYSEIQLKFKGSFYD